MFNLWYIVTIIVVKSVKWRFTFHMDSQVGTDLSDLSYCDPHSQLTLWDHRYMVSASCGVCLFNVQLSLVSK